MEMRKCRGCEGTGRTITMTTRCDTGERVFYTGRGRPVGEAARLLSAGMGYRLSYSSRRDWVLTQPCPVCGGSGKVEAKPGPEDAIWDATALHCAMAWAYGSYHGYSGLDVLELAGREGLLAVGWLAIPDAVGDGAEYHSEEAARAAFRAVPGLRGEA